MAYAPKKITLVQNVEIQLYKNNTDNFNLDAKYNDFLLTYQKTVSEQQPFSATFKTEKGQTTLHSRWGDFYKLNGDTEVYDFIDTYKKNREKYINAKVFYFNNELKMANGFNHLVEEPSIFNINNYVLDEASNKFIHKDIYKKGKDYSNAVVSDYHDESYILQYHNIELALQNHTNFDKVKLGEKALFKNKPKATPKKQVKNTSPLETTDIVAPVATMLLSDYEKLHPTKVEPVKTDTLKVEKKKKTTKN